MIHYRLKYNGSVYSTKHEMLRYVQDCIFPGGVLLKVDDPLNAEYLLVLGRQDLWLLHTAISTIFSGEVVTDEAVLFKCFDCLVSNARLVPAGVYTFVMDLGNISSESDEHVFCRVFIEDVKMADLAVDYLVPGTDRVFFTEGEAKDYVKKLHSKSVSACMGQGSWYASLGELLMEHCAKNPYNLLDSDPRLMFLLSHNALSTADSWIDDEDYAVFRDTLKSVINEVRDFKMNKNPNGDAVTAEDVLQYFLSKQKTEGGSKDEPAKSTKTQDSEPEKSTKVQEPEQETPTKPQESEQHRGTETKEDSKSPTISCDCLPYIMNNTTGGMVAVINIADCNESRRVYVTSTNFSHLKALCEIYFGDIEITSLAPLLSEEKTWVADYLGSSARCRGLIRFDSPYFYILDDTCEIRRSPHEV